MSAGIIDISPIGLALSSVFIIIAFAGSVRFRLGLEKDLLIGTLRTFAQLYLMGYLLGIIFKIHNPVITALVFAAMLGMAAQIIIKRVGRSIVPYKIPMIVSMLTSYCLVSYIVTALIVGSKPWWAPQYFIPLVGMIVGNSMSALAITVERLFSDLRAKREVVEMKLCAGATPTEATEDVVRDAIRAGMIPSINAMMGVGIVFLPGMMTGQILAGADPMVAIRYQIMVMLMLVGATAVGCIMTVMLTRRKCFNSGDSLLQDI